MLNFSPSPSQEWLSYFQGNAGREARLPFDRARETSLTTRQRAALVRTLQRFHLGESGEGEYLKRFAAQTGDATYCQAIDLFVAEEQAHSRWFGILLRRLEASTLRAHWSDAVFTKVRRSGGLHFELVTFLTAEIVGQKFFAALGQNCPETVVAAVFAQVVRDESAHIAFHIGTLRRAFAGQDKRAQWLWYWKWKAMLAMAIALVCFDQKSAFREFGLSRPAFAKICFAGFSQVAARIWAPKVSLVMAPSPLGSNPCPTTSGRSDPVMRGQTP